MAQTQLQLAQTNPQIHDLYQAYRSMYDAIGVKNINAILPPPIQPTPIRSKYGRNCSYGYENLFKLFQVKITKHTLIHT